MFFQMFIVFHTYIFYRYYIDIFYLEVGRSLFNLCDILYLHMRVTLFLINYISASQRPTRGRGSI